MRSLARISLGLLGLALIAPGGVEAQQAPTYYPSRLLSARAIGPCADHARPLPLRLARPSMPMPADPTAQLQHNHKGRGVCPACVAKAQAANPSMAGKIVACEHWKGGEQRNDCRSAGRSSRPARP